MEFDQNMTNLSQNETEDSQKYKMIFYESVDVLILTDGSTGKISDVSDNCQLFLGFEKNEIIGQHYSFLFGEEDNSQTNPASVNFYGSVLSGRKIKKKDGSKILMDLTINTFSANNKNYILCSLRDATERIKQDIAIRKYAKQLKELNANKDKFFSIIAHDLRSPLTALMGYSEMLIEDIEEMETKDIRDFIKNINSVSKNVFELLENLLHWSRVQTGNIEFYPSRITPSAIIQKIENLFAYQLKQKQITLKKELQGAQEIIADENMISTILRNLISNAIKFTPERGTITIKSYDFSKKHYFVVQDSGTGMTKEESEKLFNIGTHFSKKGTNNEVGTGLGLILTREFINFHKGIIKVESEVNQGSSFTFEIPYYAD